MYQFGIDLNTGIRMTIPFVIEIMDKWKSY